LKVGKVGKARKPEGAGGIVKSKGPKDQEEHPAISSKRYRFYRIL